MDRSDAEHQHILLNQILRNPWWVHVCVVLDKMWVWSTYCDNWLCSESCVWAYFISIILSHIFFCKNVNSYWVAAVNSFNGDWVAAVRSRHHCHDYLGSVCLSLDGVSDWNAMHEYNDGTRSHGPNGYPAFNVSVPVVFLFSTTNIEYICSILHSWDSDSIQVCSESSSFHSRLSC